MLLVDVNQIESQGQVSELFQIFIVSMHLKYDKSPNKIKARAIETDIRFPRARISSKGKRIGFSKTGTAFGAMDIRLPKPQIIQGETDIYMFLEVSLGCTQIAVSPSQ